MKIETNEHYTVITADEGKTFARKADGEVVAPEIILGCLDAPENYMEIDIPVVEDETELGTYMLEKFGI